MDKRYHSLLASNKGAALAMTLIILAVFTILLASMSLMFTTNFKMAKKQEENIKAYYLALSGIEVAKSTLLSPLYMDGGVEKTMIDKIKSVPASIPAPAEHDFNDTLVLDGTDIDIHVTYEHSTNTIRIVSHAELDTGGESTLTLALNVEGSSYSERWE